MRQRTAMICICLLFAMFAAPPVFGQMILTFTDEATLAGNSVTISALIDNDQPINGFSFGLRHDSAVLTPSSITEGPALQATNGGTGSDFFNTNLNPANGPGVVVAAVFSLSQPLDVLAVGPTHDAVALTYTTSMTANPGSTTALTPAADLGSPAAAIVYSVAGVSFIPMTNAGSVSFLVPPPTNVTCTLTDQCNCTFDISWTNGASYSTIEVRRGATLVSTLAGTATSTTLSLPSIGTETISVRGVANGQDSTDGTCTADCQAVIPADPPSNLTCSIGTADPMTGCTVDVSWTLQGTYTSFDVSVNGTLVSTLAGTATMTTLSLPVDPVAAQICILGYDECGAPLSMSVCCDALCLPGTTFDRGDCNADGGKDIGDSITALGILFGGGGPALCDDACDNNDDGNFDISDPIYQLAELFSGGPPPPPPTNTCGLDPTNDSLDCMSFPPC